MNESSTQSVGGQVRPMPSRFRHTIGKYKIVRSSKCKSCGTCAISCAQGVHFMAGTRAALPKDYLCIGPEACEAKNGQSCIAKCPNGALAIAPNPMVKSLGDYRWTADLLMSTWYQAETGEMPPMGLESTVGNSGGGFDKLRFHLPERPPAILSDDEIDTSIELNKRGDNAHRITISLPLYQGGMSFGSVSNNTMISRARAATLWDTFCCTGEGGYPEFLYPFDHHMITQVATGLFGVKEETIQRVRIIEFKYAQGAKPGLGGHLLGDKVTEAVARMREAVKGSALFSPFPFHIIHLDGSYGGTGAAPDIAKKNIAMPIEYAIPKVHRFLVEEGVRDQMTIIASGGIRTAHDVLKAIALGADGIVEGTAGMVALECTRCSSCESGRGCPRGIATTDPELAGLIGQDWGTQRVYNLYASWRKQIVEVLKKLGMRSIRELVGRTDCLRHLDYE